jgi:hypothetical protein
MSRQLQSVVDEAWSLVPTPAIEVAVYVARLNWFVPAPPFVSMR